MGQFLRGIVPPAASSEGAISSAEVRLGVSLPRSYRDFLLLHNGWHAPNESVGELTPVEQIRLLSDEQTASVAMLMSPRAARFGECAA